MAVSDDDVRAVARLARLRLTAEEASRFTEQLNAILRHMEALGDADIDDVDPMAGAIDEAAPPLRSEDVAPDELARPPAEMAPGWENGFFTVPRLAALDDDVAEGPDDGGAHADRTDGSGGGAAAGSDS